MTVGSILEGSSVSEVTSYQIAKNVALFALKKKAQDVCIIYLKGLSSVTDFFVICHGDANIQVKAIADGILDGMREMDIRAWHKEGYEFLNWVLLDYVNVVVHIFQKETRDFYRLDKLWGDVKIERITETSE